MTALPKRSVDRLADGSSVLQTVHRRESCPSSVANKVGGAQITFPKPGHEKLPMHSATAAGGGSDCRLVRLAGPYWPAAGNRHASVGGSFYYCNPVVLAEADMEGYAPPSIRPAVAGPT